VTLVVGDSPQSKASLLERIVERVAPMTLQLPSECIVLYDCDDSGLARACREADESSSRSICYISKAKSCSLPKADPNRTAADTTACISWYDDDSDGSDEDDLAFITPEIARKRLMLVSQNSVNTLDTAALSESQHSQEECCAWSHSSSFCSRDDESEWHHGTRIVRFATCDSVWVYEVPDDDDISLGELYYTADEIMVFRETFYAEFVALSAASPCNDGACDDE
jgi:hypothetical protein